MFTPAPQYASHQPTHSAASAKQRSMTATTARYSINTAHPSLQATINSNTMKFFTSFAILALSAVASASPVNTSGSVEKRAGPSGTFATCTSTQQLTFALGQVITPQGGQYFSSGGGVELEYTRVNGEQGYYVSLQPFISSPVRSCICLFRLNTSTSTL